MYTDLLSVTPEIVFTLWFLYGQHKHIKTLGANSVLDQTDGSS